MGGCYKNIRRLVKIGDFSRDVFDGFVIVFSVRSFCIVIEVNDFIVGRFLCGMWCLIESN